MLPNGAATAVDITLIKFLSWQFYLGKDNFFAMSEYAQNDQRQDFLPILDYGHSLWKSSSQYVATSYNSGAKFWRKEDLEEIERQLTESSTTDIFTVRRIDGKELLIKNPILGVDRSIWKPYVKFQEYWRLVKEEPEGPPETHLCSYLVDWENQIVRDYEGQIENARLLFAQTIKSWNPSRTCASFGERIVSLLGTKKVTKIVCFGLGDITRKAPEWWKARHSPRSHEFEARIIESRMIQHLIALTIADVLHARGESRDAVRLLAQDPDYTDETKEILRAAGFEIVGQFGAGGFAEVDDESVVFSAFVAAPVKQIIADIARPALIIRSENNGAFNSDG
ncbi:hypothetical protein F5Y06DRAFT_291479 [Hypoxylon sp. FL0890]|nr:hypothetical protein F5Y06DRAFT_291479 [Hypoxylon sp. FL0890]